MIYLLVEMVDKFLYSIYIRKYHSNFQEQKFSIFPQNLTVNIGLLQNNYQDDFTKQGVSLIFQNVVHYRIF